MLGIVPHSPERFWVSGLGVLDPGRYMPIILILYSWGSLFGVPSKVPLQSTWSVLSSSQKCLGSPLKGAHRGHAWIGASYIGFRVSPFKAGTSAKHRVCMDLESFRVSKD